MICRHHLHARVTNDDATDNKYRAQRAPDKLVLVVRKRYRYLGCQFKVAAQAEKKVVFNQSSIFYHSSLDE